MAGKKKGKIRKKGEKREKRGKEKKEKKESFKPLWGKASAAVKLTVIILTALATLIGALGGLTTAGIIFPPGPKVDCFEADPPSMWAEDSSYLSWSVSNAEIVTIDPEIGDVTPTGTRWVSPPETTIYTLTAEKGGDSDEATVHLMVEPRPVIDFAVDPLIICAGKSSELSWSVSNAISVSIDGIGSVESSGTKCVSPPETTTYTLTAENGGGSVEATVHLMVEPRPAITYFEAEPGTIQGGEISYLNWSVSNATSVTIDPGIGSVAFGGKREVSPPVTTTYTITAENGGDSVELEVVVKVKVPTEATICIEPTLKEVSRGKRFTSTIYVNPAGRGVDRGSMTVLFNPAALEVIKVESGDLLGPSPIVPPGYPMIDNVAGTINIDLARAGNTLPSTVAGDFARITFKVKDSAPDGGEIYAVSLLEGKLWDENSNEIPVYSIAQYVSIISGD
jgi:hypothetical protein